MILDQLDARIQKAGGAANITCPVCRQKTRMQVFENFSSLHVVCMPVGKFAKDYIVLCEQCASVFAISNTAYKALRGGNASFLNAEHMTLLVDGIAHKRVKGLVK